MVKNFSELMRKIRQNIRDSLTLFPTQNLMLETYLIGKDGKVKEHHKGKAHSYVIGWLQHLEIMMSHPWGTNGNTVSIKDTSATVGSFQATNGGVWCYLAANAASTITTYGILCGTGTTTVNVSDYTIESLIANGSGSGQLNYSATAVLGAITGATTCSLAISRAVSNGYSASISVRNIGLVLSTQNTGSTQKFILVIHDNVNQTIASGETYIIIYTMSTSISS